MSSVFRIIIIYFFFFNIIFYTNIFVSYSSETNSNDCFNNYYDKKNNIYLNQITIETNESRKWYKNILSIYQSFIENDIIEKKYKKKHKVLLIAKYSNGEICKYSAYIRVKGLSRFHLSKENFITSMDVKLISGHINNITGFNLFLPSSRSHKNEIFVNSFLESLGFIVPRIQMINVSFNKKNQKFIFIEKFNKEFLENNKLREGPIYLNANTVKNIGFNSFKIENTNWIKNDFERFISASEGLKKINNFFSLKKGDNRLFNTDKLINNDNKILIDNYHAALMSLNAFHGLGLNNQVFYFDLNKDIFLPIYNDGKSRFLKDKNIDDGNFNSQLENYKDFIPKNDLKTKINKINLTNLLETLKIRGLVITYNDLNNHIDLILNRLDKINEIYMIENSNHETFDAKNEKNFKSLYLSDYDQKIFKICDNFSFNCNKFNFINLSQSKILKQKKLPENLLKQSFVKTNHIYLGSDQDEIDDNFRNFSNKISFGKFKLYTNNDVQIIKNDKINRILELKQINENGRAIILGDEINNWNITFKGVVSTGDYKNFNNLTGCITFLDLNILNLNLYSEWGHCEDSVNFIRTSGKNNIIHVINSYSDGVDVDFSNISFDKITIKNSKNDCIDFSGGNYKIYSSDLNLCGDKAISVGEFSDIEVFKSNIENSNIGIASKDSSNTTVHNIIITNVEYCAAAYKKKQEFSGGYISFDKINCQNYFKKFLIDKFSKIIENS